MFHPHRNKYYTPASELCNVHAKNFMIVFLSILCGLIDFYINHYFNIRIMGHPVNLCGALYFKFITLFLNASYDQITKIVSTWLMYKCLFG